MLRLASLDYSLLKKKSLLIFHFQNEKVLRWLRDWLHWILFSLVASGFYGSVWAWQGMDHSIWGLHLLNRSLIALRKMVNEVALGLIGDLGFW